MNKGTFAYELRSLAAGFRNLARKNDLENPIAAASEIQTYETLAKECDAKATAIESGPDGEFEDAHAMFVISAKARSPMGYQNEAP